MFLAPGTRLGPYEITTTLGAGGMGEVYRATDTHLKRAVAIKVLPEAVAGDPDRLARFQREAELLAALNHPNIAQIYGLEACSGSTRALVMELVEGDDLSTLIARGPISVSDALPIARQIADALEAAHEAGIVHRDLKPANIKVRGDGMVKVLDFGLAKAAPPEGASASADAMRSPTLTAAAFAGGYGEPGTQMGMIVGTAAYMAPEQARGKAVDKRADIWAFGVVLYEMLSGKRLFEGDTISDVLAAVLRADVDWQAIPVAVPAELRRLVVRCLDRDPKQRLRDIGEARVVLEGLLTGRTSQLPARLASRRRFGTLAIVGVAALVLGFGLGRFGQLGRDAAPVGSTAGEISFERLTFRPGHFTNARFAPDGQTAFLSAAWRDHTREIFQVRPQAGELPIGLAHAELLSVSRTGELALLLPRVETGNPYVSAGTLAVVSASGGTPRELAEDVTGADWAPDGGSLAALRIVGNTPRLEYPLGTVLYETSDRLFSLRVSHSGDAVAFFESDPAGLTSVVVVDRAGQRRVWSAQWADWWSLTWSPDDREIWFSAARAGVAANVYAVDRTGGLRTLLSTPGTLVIHDVSADSTALIAQAEMNLHTRGRTTGETSDRDLSWLEASSAVDLAVDGRAVLLRIDSEREPGRTAVFLRSMDGAPPVRLGYGIPQELSRDGKWALAIRAGTLVAMPTAAGKERTLVSSFPVLTAARWLPDGDRVLVIGIDAQGRRAASLVSFSGGSERSLTLPLEFRFGNRDNRLLSPVSPDGRHVAIAAARGGLVVVPLEGGESRPVPGSDASDHPIQWTRDGRRLLTLSPLPGTISEIDLASGRRQVLHTLLPADRVGVAGVTQAHITPDPGTYVYTYQHYRSDLYRVKGLR